MEKMIFPGLVPSEILLPRSGTDLRRWAVIACDQFTSEPEYWRRVETLVGEAPSTLRLVQPEAFLARGDNRRAIHAAMERYLADGTLVPAVEHGFVLVERSTPSGARKGLLAALDLECYDFETGRLLCRATEDTVADRLPPRVKIREEAALELPHAIVLIDDPDFSVIEPMFEQAAPGDLLYDFELMEQGGRLRGWRLEDTERLRALSAALRRLGEKAEGFLYAVGDGNHSLAAAKQCYETAKRAAPGKDTPLRCALVELVNLHSPAMVFEPIHRLITGCRPEEFLRAFSACPAFAAAGAGKSDVVLLTPEGDRPFQLRSEKGLLPVAEVQNFLDGCLAGHPEAGVDYIHGEENLRALCRKDGSPGILLPAIDKHSLFRGIRCGGHLPRKAFSIGEAREKRYYMECRRLKEKGDKKP